MHIGLIVYATTDKQLRTPKIAKPWLPWFRCIREGTPDIPLSLSLHFHGLLELSNCPVRETKHPHLTDEKYEAQKYSNLFSQLSIQVQCSKRWCN